MTKMIVSLAAAIGLTLLASPAFACGCDSSDDWNSVGARQWLEAGDTMSFNLDLDPNSVVDVYVTSDRVQNHIVDLDLDAYAPSGREVASGTEFGDDAITVHTGRGGEFEFDVQNVDDEFGTNFTLNVVYR